MMKLIDGFKGKMYSIDKIHLERWDAIKLERMAIKEGSILLIIQNVRGYPFLVECMGNRIAFGKDVAYQIEVIPYV